MNLKISNIVATGKIPFQCSLRSKEMVKILEKGDLDWNIVNQDSSPMLMARFKKDGFNKFGKRKTCCISIWHSGNFQIAGAQKIIEAKKIYEIVELELRNIVPRVFEEDNGN